MILQVLLNTIKKSPKTAIFISMLGLYSCVFLVVGIIPVNEGAGWDGKIFLHIIETLGSGSWPAIDPYREIRIGGFLPITAATYLFDLKDASIIKGQIIVNALQLAISVSIFFDFLLRLGLDKRTAIISIGSLVFSWPVLVMPIYYPLLSDHSIIFIVCISIWLWSNSKYIGLVIVSAFSPLVMPGLFLVPLTMTALYFEPREYKLANQTICKMRRIIIPILIMFVGVLILAVAYRSSIILEQQRLPEWNGTAFESIYLKLVSLLMAIIMLILLMWKLVFIGSTDEILRRIAFRPACWALIATAITHVGLYIYLQNSDGFKGPPLFDYMLLQTMTFPAAPMIAHFLYFGPVFFVVLWSIFCIKKTKNNTAIPFYFIFSLFFPALVLGSETRQWLAVFPIIVVCFSLTKMSMRLRFIVLLVSMFLCLPMFLLGNQIKLAQSTTTDFMSSGWQYYFGRQGPWMSISTYLIGLSIAALFVIACYFINLKRVSSTKKRQ